MPELKWRIKDLGHGKGAIFLACEAMGVLHADSQQRECRFSIWDRPAQGCMWQWNGDTVGPTITPSVNCHGGCGRHFTMTNGVPIHA